MSKYLAMAPLSVNSEAELIETPETPVMEKRKSHPANATAWSEAHRAYLLKHWPNGTAQKHIEAQTAIAKHLGRTNAACQQQYRLLTLDPSKKGALKQIGTKKLKMISQYSPNLTFEEQKEILETFGSFTPEMKSLILSLRHYEKPKVTYFNHEEKQLVVTFY